MTAVPPASPPPPPPPKLPPPSASISADQVNTLLTSYQSWSKGAGTMLLDLDDELGRHPTISKADHTLAFVIWTAADKVIGEAIQTLAFPDQRLVPLRSPLSTLDGTKLAENVDEATQLVGALAAAVSKQLADSAIASSAQIAIVEHLAIAAPLVKQLSMRAGELSQLRSQLDALEVDSSAAAIAELCRRAASLRADLEAANTERTTLLTSAMDEAAALAELVDLETKARSVSDLCRQKVKQSPRIGIVSVAALGEAPALTDLETQPWPQARALLSERATKLERAQRSLLQVISTNEALLAKRAELRQLVDAYRAKAMGGRIGEVQDVNAAYQVARDLLWAAPCDLDAGATAVDSYVHIVTSRLGSVSSQSNPERSVLR